MPWYGRIFPAVLKEIQKINFWHPEEQIVKMLHLIMFRNWRISEKHHLRLRTGALMQYIPSKGMYVYFRYDNNQTILCALNSDTFLLPFILRIIQKEPKAFETATDMMTGSITPFRKK